MNEKAIASEADDAKRALYQDADKYCKNIFGKLSRGHGCLKALAFVVIAVGVGAAVISPNMDSLDLNKLFVFFSS
ncbi:hypothetical protein COLO4_11968 [Corchorus olitorius]|uniref:Uncharacterized protein n=1 Tax=Corchorus olitorius TaxID=93759 RepID=A0A1R3K2N2_9ROSI|nr:hypothetical protein COLO4_11968 [Corchorus olitorius]